MNIKFKNRNIFHVQLIDDKKFFTKLILLKK